MFSKLKTLGGSFLGTIGCLAVLVIPTLFFFGATWASNKLLPWFFFVSGLSFWILCLVILPLLFFRSLRAFSAKAIFGISYVFGATLWMWSLLLTIHLWGAGWAAFGLFFAGIGVLPMAFLASAFKGLWVVFGGLIFLAVMTFGLRMLSFWIVVKIDETNHGITKHYETIDKDVDDSISQGEITESYRVLAEEGDADSQNELAWCYLCGHGVTQDLEEAFHWWEKAAYQGHTDAQFSLAGCYDSGDGVDLNYCEAFVWYDLCANWKSPKASAKRDEIAAKLTTDELSQCKERVRVLSIQIPKSASDNGFVR